MGNCYVLECSAPSVGHDLFVARTPRAVVRWLQHALVTRGFAARKLIDITLEGRLDCRVWRVENETAQPPLDLRPALSLSIDDVPAASLSAADRLEALRRRLARRPDDEPVFVINASAIESLLPPLPEPIAQPGQTVRVAPGPALEVATGAFAERVRRGETFQFGASLVDPSETYDDPDPAGPVERAAPSAQVAALFDAVYRAPEDAGRRSVLADALLELGDPRGELIQLQLARGSGGAPSRQEQGLLKRHEAEWLGDLARILKDVDWRGGFLYGGTLIAAYPALLRRPELLTLRELWFRCDAPFTASLAGLERATGVRSAGLATLSEQGHGRLMHLGVELRESVNRGVAVDGERLRTDDGEGAATECFRRAHLPAVRTLSVEMSLSDAEAVTLGGSSARREYDSRDFDWLWPLPLLRQIETFKTTQMLDALPSWLRLPAAQLPVPRLVLKLASSPATLGLWGGYVRAVKPVWVALRRDTDELLAVHREVDPTHRDVPDALESVLAACAGTAWRRVRFFKREPSASDRRLAKRSGDLSVELVESLPPPGTF